MTDPIDTTPAPDTGAAAAELTPPTAKQVPHERTHHGDTLVDSYEWLRAKDDPETVAYLEAENAYTKQQTAHLSDLREAVFDEIKGHTQETDLSVPSRRGDFWYYARTIEGQQYPLMCRCAVADPNDWTPPALEPGSTVSGEQVLLDCNELAAGQEFFSLSAFSVDLDGRLLAYSTDLVGNERFTIGVVDLSTGELLPDTIENTVDDAVWAADGLHLFYITVDEAWRPDKVWRHRLGTAAAEDVLAFTEPDERFWTGIGRTTSDRYLVIHTASKITSEVRILEADDPTGDFRVVLPRTVGVEYEVNHAVIGGQDRLLVLHNQDAENFTLGVGPMSLGSLDELEPLLPPDPGVRVSDFDVSASTLVVNIRRDGLTQVRVFRLDDRGIGDGTDIEFDEGLYSVHAFGFSDWRQPLVRLGYQSWVTPATVIEYDPVTTQQHVRKQQPVLGYDPADYVQTREWVTGGDGTKIPLSIVHHKRVEPRSQAPLMLLGYGAYEISMDPNVNIPALSLFDRGMVFACAHVRGGGEMGRGWYEHGKRLEKQNTFTDYVDCARYLVDTGWTAPERQIGFGGSAGGLLMGAAANLAPECFAGICAVVPFVDALTSILDPSLPLTVTEWDEWGDPLHDPEVYAYMKAYTPYENVSAKDYPAIYAITNINDTRVLYVEPAKWVAQLRNTATGASPVLLKCEMSAGHGGASGRYDRWREQADYNAWIIDTSGAPHRPIGRHAEEI